MIAVVDKSENHSYLCSVLGMGMRTGMRMPGKLLKIISSPSDS